MQRRIILSDRQSKLRAWMVHAYTALGLPCAFLALLAASEGRARDMFLILMLAIAIDGTDGPMARRFDVKRWTPHFDGRKLDACLDNDEYRFLARGWDWVDPQKEVLAHKEAIALGLTTRSRVIAERTGEDIEDVLDDLALENAMMIERGLEHRIGVVVQASEKAGDKQPPEPADEDEEDDAEEE